MTDQDTVFIVTDDPSTSDLYSARLRDDFAVRTAPGREEALEEVSDDVSVVLLDGRTPDFSSEDLLSTVRDRGVTCRAALITPVVPEGDVLDRGFDTALIKPVSERDLIDTVETLCRRVEYDQLLQEATERQAERVALERHHSQSELADHEEYQALTAEFAELKARLDELAESMDDLGVTTVLHSLSRRSRDGQE